MRAIAESDTARSPLVDRLMTEGHSPVHFGVKSWVPAQRTDGKWPAGFGIVGRFERRAGRAAGIAELFSEEDLSGILQISWHARRSWL